MPLTTVDRVSSWAKKDVDASRQDELARCIAAASDVLAGITGRSIERVTRSIFLDGCEATGKASEILYLPMGDRPVIHSGTDLVTVSENGISLAVVTGYTTSDAVIVRNANVDRRCELVRRSGWYWDDGLQNVAVTYKCGWVIDSPLDPAQAPAKVIQLVNCLSWMIFQEPSWLGKLNVSQQGSAVTLTNDLPSYEASILASLVIF
jgi:hypothetical protein